MHLLHLLAFSASLLSAGAEPPCPVFVSVDITDGRKDDGVIVKNNVAYAPSDYFYHEGEIRGCICNIRPCVRKCCPKGHIMNNRSCQEAEYEQSFKVHRKTEPISLPEDYFHYVHNNHCVSNQSYILDPSFEEDLHYLQEDGTLLWPSFDMVLSVEEFCIETFNDEIFNYTDTVLVCFTEAAKPEMFYVGK